MFIAQAVASSEERLTQLRYPLSWLQNSIMSTLGDMSGFAEAAQSLAKESPRIAEELARFLREVDVPVKSLRFEDLPEARFGSVASSDDVKPVPPNIGAGKLARYLHETELGTAEFWFSEESRGTQNLIGFWLPWGLLRQRSEEDQSCRILVVDELDNSLHPNIVASIVEKHLATDLRTQLIFTTHDTHLMNTRLLRRDQLWVTERDRNGATVLRSIHDFEGREGEDVEKRYFEGRYRGLPITRRS